MTDGPGNAGITIGGLRKTFKYLALLVLVLAFGSAGAPGQTTGGESSIQMPTVAQTATHGDGATVCALSMEFARIDVPIAGVAADESVVFVGEPLDGKVVALSRWTAAPIGELPPPAGGFVLPFIMHAIGRGRVAVLDAGGLPAPNPFVPANPVIHEYEFEYSRSDGFSATLVRSISFAGAVIGFPEDFVRLDDGRYLMSDAVLGSVWVVNKNGSISPGIVPKTYAPQDLIPALAFCPTMPQVTVNGVPFLFTGSSLPGISPMAVRHGTVYYFSPCARGIYTFPLSILSDRRAPYQRAADIRLLAATPADVEVEELLDFGFNPYNPQDRFLYAADPLQMQVIRVDPATGGRQVVARDPKLLDFPSSLAFLPSAIPLTELLVVSNQQERSPLTNDAVTQTTFDLPFSVSRILVLP
jgi:hypothetical protein